MGLFDTLARLKHRADRFLTSMLVVKRSLEIVLVGYVLLLVVAYVVAAAFGQPTYTLWDNYISDLGSFVYTPAPFFYDIACMVAGVGSIPFTVYMESVLAPLPRTEVDIPRCSRLRFQLASYGFLASLTGNLGYIFVGIFSEDRLVPIGDPSDMLSLHMIFSGITFGGYVAGACFSGWCIVFYDTPFPKALGWYAVCGPLAALVLNLFGWNIWQATGVNVMPGFEWLMLFAILGFVIPAAIVTMRGTRAGERTSSVAI